MDYLHLMAIKEFLYSAHCENGRPSSKRLYGGIGWLVIQACLLTACVLSFIKGEGITEVIKDLFFFDLSISATLIGLSTITGAFGKSTIQATSCADETSQPAQISHGSAENAQETEAKEE